MKRLLVLLVLICISLTTLNAQDNLFKNINGNYKPTQSAVEKINIFKSRIGILKSEIVLFKTKHKFNKNYKGIFNLFDKNIEFEITDDYGENVQGIYGYRANLKYGGYAVISLSKAGITATVFYKDRVFNIEPIDKKLHFISEINLEEIACNDIYDNGNQVLENYPVLKEADFRSTTPATIKVLAVYTTEAAQANGNIEGIIINAVSETNNAYERSDVATRIELAHIEQIPYTESGSASTDVDRFMNKGDGFLDEIHSLRTQYEADICVLIVDNLNACGRVPDFAIPAMYYNAFCVIRANCAVPNYSLAHEIVHLLGCFHEDGYFGTLKLYNVKRKYRTIMSITIPEKYKRVPYFSNPNVYDQEGVSIGTANNFSANKIDYNALAIADFEPRFSASIDGPTILTRDEEGTYNCEVVSGISPYNYKWEIMKIDEIAIKAWPSNLWFEVGYDSPTYTKPVPNNGDYRDFKLRCIVTDEANKRVFSNELRGQYTGPLTKMSDNNTSLEFKKLSTPEKTELKGNYPNPFNPKTTISYQLNKTGFVNIVVFNSLGKEVATLVDEIKSKGYHKVTFDGANLSSGFYIYKIKTNSFNESKKMLLMK